MWAAALLALTLRALSQGAACRLPAFPSWRHLHGGGRHGGGWFARTVELLAVMPALLVAPSCLTAAVAPLVSGAWPGLGGLDCNTLACSPLRAPTLQPTRPFHSCHPPHPAQARQLRPHSAARLRGATSAALLYWAGLTTLLAVCACLLFGRSVQVSAEQA